MRFGVSRSPDAQLERIPWCLMGGQQQLYASIGQNVTAGWSCSGKVARSGSWTCRCATPSALTGWPSASSPCSVVLTFMTASNFADGGSLNEGFAGARGFHCESGVSVLRSAIAPKAFNLWRTSNAGSSAVGRGLCSTGAASPGPAPVEAAACLARTGGLFGGHRGER